MASSAQAKAFIDKIGVLIQQEAKNRGYKVASSIIAQACIESAYGESLLSKTYFNYFGMKCGSAWKGKSVNLKTKEEYNSQLVTIKDNFRVFDNMEDGVKGYFDFVSTKRYANLKTATTPKEYLEMIKADGYATSSSYVSTNMGVVTRYDLTKFDGFSVVSDEANINPYEEPQRTLKRADKGEDVKWVQYEMNRRGYNVGSIDGIYGQKTYSAICLFQKTCDGRLAVDGIVGRKTREELKK